MIHKREGIIHKNIGKVGSNALSKSAILPTHPCKFVTFEF